MLTAPGGATPMPTPLPMSRPLLLLAAHAWLMPLLMARGLTAWAGEGGEGVEAAPADPRTSSNMSLRMGSLLREALTMVRALQRCAASQVLHVLHCCTCTRPSGDRQHGCFALEMDEYGLCRAAARCTEVIYMRCHSN